MIVYSLLLLSCASFSALYPQETLKNPQPEEQTVATRKNVFFSGGAFFASDGPGYKDKTLTMIHSVASSTAFGKALTPELAIVNGEEEQPHPLYDATINFLTELSDKPLCVTKEKPHELVMLDPLTTTTSSQQVRVFTPHDTHGIPVGAIHGVDVVVTGDREHNNLVGYIVMGVSPVGKKFGHPGSGLAVLKKTSHAYTKRFHEGGQDIDREVVDVFYDFMKPETEEEYRSFPLDATTPELSINNGRFSLCNEHYSICQFLDLGRFYVGLSVKTDSSCSSNQGAHALLKGLVVDNEIVFEPVTLPGVSISPISASGAHKSATVHMMQPLYTASGSSYLIVVGGQGSFEETKRTVSALPLVHKARLHNSWFDFKEDPENGLIAAKDSSVQHHLQKMKNKPEFFRGLRLEDPATTNHAMPSSYDRAVCVGAGAPLPHDITRLVVVNDAVYALVSQDGAHEKAGAFHSQPIFDTDGRIAAWTPWQRAFGLYEGVSNIKADAKSGLATIIKEDSHPIHRITQTAWCKKRATEQTEAHLPYALSLHFDKEKDGVLGLFDYGRDSTKNCSFLVATGFDKVILAETASYRNGFFASYENDYVSGLQEGKNFIPPVDCAEDTPAVIALSGDVLKELGPISFSTIVSNDTCSWLVVGAVNGIAALCDEHGRGWKTADGVAPHFANLSGMSFKKIAECSGIRKLCSDKESLYVLTNKTVCKACLDSNAVLSQSVSLESVVELPNCGFFDMAISDQCMVLGTTKGLFISSDYTQKSFEQITLPNSFGHVYTFYVVSPTGRSNGFAHGGQLYVLSGSPRHNATSIFRLFVDKENKETPYGVVPAYEYSTIQGPYLSFNSYRNCFATDGASYLVAHPRQSNAFTYLKVLGMSEIYFAHLEQNYSYIAPLHLNKSKKINAIIKNSATGEWLFAGDFGIKVNGQL